MGFVLLIIGGPLLWYWWTGMSMEKLDRPRVLNEHGGKVALAGLTLVILGAYQFF
jgi:hypothetical protein